MARLVCKHSVRFKAFTPAMLHLVNASYAAATVTTTVPEIVITSANDSAHSEHSKHYLDQALDYRVRHFPSRGAVLAFKATLEANLGPQFRVLYESAGTPNAHLHAQTRKGMVYDPHG